MAGSGIAGSGIAGSGIAGSGIAGSGIAGLGDSRLGDSRLGYRWLGRGHDRFGLGHDRLGLNWPGLRRLRLGDPRFGRPGFRRGPHSPASRRHRRGDGNAAGEEAQSAGPDSTRVKAGKPVRAGRAVVRRAETAADASHRRAHQALQQHARLAGLNPLRAVVRGHVRPGPAADRHGEPRSDRSEGKDRGLLLRAVAGRGVLEGGRDLVGELPAVSPGGRDLLERVEQDVDELPVLQAAQQDQVAVPGQDAIAGNRPQARRVRAR